MKKFYLTLFIYSLHIYASAQVPVISSFTPLSGAAGGAVSITGTNFSTTPSNNTVYFGGVKAQVTGATATTINALVPAGSMLQPLSVTANALTAYSSRRFVTGFNNPGAYAVNSFAPAQTINSGTIKPYMVDLDNDGFLDMVTILVATHKIVVYRNTGNPGEFSFGTGTEYAMGGGSTFPGQVCAGDFDGDGKLDLAVALTGSGTMGLAIFRNISTAGNIAFDNFIFYSVNNPFGDYPKYVTAADIDGDGKVDLVFSYAASGRAFAVGRNTTVGSAISFAPKVDISFLTGNVHSIYGVFAIDIDADNKTDVAVLSETLSMIALYKNTSIPGTISFALKVTVNRPGSIGSNMFNMDMADVDGDGKPEIGYVQGDTALLYMYKNVSTASGIAYNAAVTTPMSVSSRDLSFNDYDGDGLTDVAILNYYDSVAIYRNTGTAIGPVTAKYKAAPYLYVIESADVDADGKVDIIVNSGYASGFDPKNIYVLRNQFNSPIINSSVPLTAATGTPVTLRGQGFTNATAVSFGNSPASSFTVLSDTVIVAVVGAGASGYVSVSSTTGIGKYPGFTFSPPIPVITSFSPMTGPVGTSVTIKGINFGVGAGNTVFFGAVRGNVTAADDTSIVVTVPAGANFKPITVTTVDNLTAWSAVPFIITFPGGPGSFARSNFADTAVKLLTSSLTWDASLADFNNDGLSEVATGIWFYTNRISLSRNTSTNGKVSFANTVEYPVFYGSFFGNSGEHVSVKTVDIDGDGKLDMLSVSGTPDSISIFRNTTTGTTPTFAAKKDYYGGNNPHYISLADIDGDGKADMAVASLEDRMLSVYKNISSPGNINFQPKREYLIGSGFYPNFPEWVLLQDLDGDSKPEMISINGAGKNLLVYRNLSAPGIVSFTDSIVFPNSTTYLQPVDMDADGKVDLVGMSGLLMTIYKNTSALGNISFVKTDYPLLNNTAGLTISDLNGDGKPDIALNNNYNTTNRSFFKNNSTPGNIVLAARVDMPILNIETGQLISGDVTGDGKPDLIFTDYYGTYPTYQAYVLRNKIGEPVSTQLCPGVDSVILHCNNTGALYQWQVDDGNGYIDVVNNTNYSGATTVNLRIKPIPAAWYGYQYRCVVDGVISDIFTLLSENRWKGTVNNNWETPGNWSCGKVPDANSSVRIPAGSNVFINSNVTIRNLDLNPSANLTVRTGFTLTVLH